MSWFAPNGSRSTKVGGLGRIAEGQTVNLDDILPLLDSPAGDPFGGKPVAPDRHTWFFCPVHADGSKHGRRSATFHPRYGLTCFAGCERRDIIAALQKRGGVHPAHTPSDSSPAHRSRSKAIPGRIVARYPYPDERGQLLYEALRKETADGKTFLLRRPNGMGGWIWNIDGMRRVLYRLPELLAADPSAFVFICEGEKRVDALARLGLTATTNVGGAGKWKPACNDYLRRRRVVILPDNDPPGAEHAEQVARSLMGVAAEVRVIVLPGLPFKGDIINWLAAGGNREILLALAERPPTERPSSADFPKAVRVSVLNAAGVA